MHASVMGVAIAACDLERIVCAMIIEIRKGVTSLEPYQVGHLLTVVTVLQHRECSIVTVEKRRTKPWFHPSYSLFMLVVIWLEG